MSDRTITTREALYVLDRSRGWLTRCRQDGLIGGDWIRDGGQGGHWLYSQEDLDALEEKRAEWCEKRKQYCLTRGALLDAYRDWPREGNATPRRVAGLWIHYLDTHGRRPPRGWSMRIDTAAEELVKKAT